MANIGYIRVSTESQNTARQLENVSLDKVFEDKISSSKPHRPALADCLSYLREGDTLHVHSIDRLARNLVELQTIVQELTKRGIIVIFHSENISFGNNSSGNKLMAMQELLFQILGAFAQFERNLIRERQQEGIERAKKEGRHLGRPRKLSPKDKEKIRKQHEDGTSPTKLAEEYSVNVSTVYNVLKKV